jgi:hypothetical protein
MYVHIAGGTAQSRDSAVARSELLACSRQPDSLTDTVPSKCAGALSNLARMQWFAQKTHACTDTSSIRTVPAGDTIRCEHRVSSLPHLLERLMLEPSQAQLPYKDLITTVIAHCVPAREWVLCNTSYNESNTLTTYARSAGAAWREEQR